MKYDRNFRRTRSDSEESQNRIFTEAEAVGKKERIAGIYVLPVKVSVVVVAVAR